MAEPDLVLMQNGGNNNIYGGEDWTDYEEDKENVSGDGVPLLVKLTESAFSGAMFERKAAARQIQDAFAQAYFMDEPIANIMIVIERLVEDDEQAVRTEITDQLPKIALFCQEISSQLDFVVPQHILPFIVRLLSDEFSQVRKSAQNGIALLLEKGILTADQIQEHVYPIIMNLTSHLPQPSVNDDEHRTEATSFMSKLAMYLGKEVTVNCYLERFCRLCCDTLFQVRRACAASMGEIAKVVGASLTQEILLPNFLRLCEDEAWGVRKGCAEIFTSVSSICQMRVRKDTLSPAFIKLLEDPSKWVRVSAYESLGSLIASYSSTQDELDDSIVGRTQLEEEFIQRFKTFGILSESEDDFQKWFKSKTQKLNVINKPESSSPCLRNGSGDAQAKDNLTGSDLELEELEDAEKSFCMSQNDLELEDWSLNDDIEIQNGDTSSNPNISDGISVQVPIEVERELNIDEICANWSESNFNSWQYWRLPVTNLDLDIACTFEQTSAENSKDSFFDTPKAESLTQEADTQKSCDNREEIHTDRNVDDSFFLGDKPRERKGSGGFKSRGRIKSPVNKEKSIRKDDIWGDFEEAGDSREEFLEFCEGSSSVQFEMDLEEESATRFEKLVSERGDRSSPGSVPNTFDMRGIHAEDNQQRIAESNSSPVDFNVHKSYMNLFHPSPDETSQGYDQDYYNEISAMFESDDLPYILKTHGPKGKSKLLPTIPETETGSLTEQNIVPEDLLKHFIEMCSPLRDHNMESELANVCVFSLPAVVYTLGRENWCLIRNCFESLALRYQWKIRYTLAASLHEIAAVLGPDISGRDLLPFFAAMTKDLDDVRIGILRNLSAFVKVLFLKDRKLCLESLRSFLITDNKRNWRFRVELSEQLALLADLYEIEDVVSFLCPVAMELILDAVAGVRQAAVDLVCVLMKRLNGAQPNAGYAKLAEFISQCAELLCHSKRWTHRQIFASLSAALLKSEALSAEQYAQYILPHFLNLSDDPIPNVRIVVAQTISSLLQLGEFADSSNPHNHNLLSTISMLQCDPDQDVIYFSGGNTKQTTEKETIENEAETLENESMS